MAKTFLKQLLFSHYLWFPIQVSPTLLLLQKFFSERNILAHIHIYFIFWQRSLFSLASVSSGLLRARGEWQSHSSPPNSSKSPEQSSLTILTVSNKSSHGVNSCLSPQHPERWGIRSVEPKCHRLWDTPLTADSFWSCIVQPIHGAISNIPYF